MSTQRPGGSDSEAGGCWAGGSWGQGGQAIKGFMENLLLLISANGEPLWVLKQRKTVFNEDNSSSCVEDRGKEGSRGSQPESCTEQQPWRWK